MCSVFCADIEVKIYEDVSPVCPSLNDRKMITNMSPSRYLLPHFREGVSVFLLEVPVVKVGEGRRGGERSRLPELPDVQARHCKEDQEPDQVQPHLPSRGVSHHWRLNTHTRTHTHAQTHARTLFILVELTVL